MFWKACIVFVVVYVSKVSTQSTQFCFGDVFYIRPDSNAQRNWTDAQEICKGFSSTLPLVENTEHQRSFEAAVLHFTTENERNIGIWIGATAFYSQSANWTWLNGSEYSRNDLQSQGEFSKSYAYISNTSSTGIRAYAESPTKTYSYICYYPTPAGVCKNETGQTAFYIENRCFVKYDEQLAWFSARNNCLAKRGDLASFTQLSLLDGKIDSSEYWVGLRSSQWKWQNAVTGLSSDVTLTLWKEHQPDGGDPSCISTDTHESFPSWRDWDCAKTLPFICQVNTTIASIPSTAICTTPSTTPRHTMTRSSTIKNNSSTTHSPSSNEDTQTNDTGAVDTIALGVGIGVGIGVPVVIVLVVIIVIFVRRKRQSSRASGNSQSRKTFVTGNSHRNPEMDQTEMSETQNGGTTRTDNSAAQYATITEATGPKMNQPSTQGTFYEGLRFDQAGSS